MILFFKTSFSKIYAVGVSRPLGSDDVQKLIWLFGEAEYITAQEISSGFVGPRKEMITPFSTNAVEITQNMGINGIKRIEEFHEVSKEEANFDPMLQVFYPKIDQSIFTINKTPEAVIFIDDIHAYNKNEGLALSEDEVEYLEEVSLKLNRKLTDSEVLGFLKSIQNIVVIKFSTAPSSSITKKSLHRFFNL